MKTLKRAASGDSTSSDDLLAEYRFDYDAAKPNRFAERIPPGSRIVVLYPDVARYFTTTEQVNTLLRAVIATVPERIAS